RPSRPSLPTRRSSDLRAPARLSTARLLGGGPAADLDLVRASARRRSATTGRHARRWRELAYAVKPFVAMILPERGASADASRSLDRKSTRLNSSHDQI